MGTPELKKILFEFRRFNTEEARAAFADKWVRLTSRQMNSMWTVLYELLRIIRDKRLHENPIYMADKRTYATFEDYWEAIVQKPFSTWLELEQTYHFVQEHAPRLFTKPLAEATKASERIRLAAEKTDGVTLDWGGNRRPERNISSGNLPLETHIQRAAVNDVSPRTQRKLDHLAREFPEQHARVKAGEVSVHRACVEAGFVPPTTTIPLEPLAAARALRKHFRGADREALIRALQADD